MSLVRSYEAAALGPPRPFAAAVLDGRSGAGDLLAPLRFTDRPAAVTLPSHGNGPSVDRSALAAALAVANNSYGHPRAGELAGLLADPRTRVVVTGQQPGLLGGPLLTAHKAIAAVKWAEALAAATGGPAVAVFWMATEDHDWAEMSQGAVLTAANAERFTLGEDPAALAPAGTRTFGPALPPLLERLREALPNDWARDRFAHLTAPYRAEARFGEAFARLLVRLLGERCPLLLDAMLPEVKTAQRPVLRRLVTQRAAVEAALEEAAQRLVGRGFEPQVAPSQRGVSPLFLLRGAQRRRVVWRDEDRFSLRGEEEGEGARELSVAELLASVDENPGVVSAGVLARPVVQDAILGTDLQVLGAAELGYMAQAAALYETLDVAPPSVALRAQAIAVDPSLVPRVEPWLDRLGDLLRDGEERLLGRLAMASDRDAPGERTRQAIEAAMASLRSSAVGLDASLERPWQKTRESVLRALDQFDAKLTAAAARRDSTALERLRRLREICRPLDAPQERTLTVAPAAARWGQGWIDDLHLHLPLDPRRAILIAPEESR